MPYAMELTKLPLTAYRQALCEIRLTPGRMPLRVNIAARFAAMEQAGVHNAAQLQKALATPVKLTAFAAATGVPADYLKLLKRELGSLMPKPVALSAFANVQGTQVAALAARGIATAEAYYNSDPPVKDVLYALCALTRINGVGAAAAEAFWYAGYTTVEAVAEANAAAMLAAVTKANETHRCYRAKLGEKDMQFCIDYARLLVKHSE